MNTVIYLILFFVVIALLVFGAVETLPKIHKLNTEVQKNIKQQWASDKDKLASWDNEQKKTSTITSQYVILAIVATLFVLGLVFPEIANNYVLIIMFIMEAYFIYLGLKLPALEKKHSYYSKEALPKRLQAVKLTFFLFIGFFVAVDVLMLIAELLYSQNIRLF
ncbi:hypothetical protein [Apilactobacillus bombintestini]|uniref:Uncharacterized protein n=1 Tax=Apilactobacillus bombintestini TaxID=2419772 RepID=A0A387AU34_9LACO|nr:hypothetical protein [Apilactobacillus bombintestini]AYF92256.1 hypothetical protein D7I45_01500 [Apilactobacillus bombintestini]